MMRLQMSLDRVDMPTALALLETTHDVVDIVEVGTPFVLSEGFGAVRTIRNAYPNLTILADCKIMDGGEYNSNKAFEAGADIVTVLAVSEDNTIRGAIKAAKDSGREVLVDLIAVPDLETRVKQVEAMQPTYIGVHTGLDVQAEGKKPIDALKRLMPLLQHAKAAVAGGITLDTLPQIAAMNPAIIIAGAAITRSSDPRKTILDMKAIMQGHG